MSSPIMPTKGPLGPSTAAPSAGSDAGDIGAFVSELAASDSALALEASRGGPPPEVLDQMAAAGRIDEQLRASGFGLRFSSVAPGERARIEVRDREGNAVRTLSASEAVDIAAGKPLG